MQAGSRKHSRIRNGCRSLAKARFFLCHKNACLVHDRNTRVGTGEDVQSVIRKPTCAPEPSISLRTISYSITTDEISRTCPPGYICLSFWSVGCRFQAVVGGSVCCSVKLFICHHTRPAVQRWKRNNPQSRNVWRSGVMFQSLCICICQFRKVP